MFPPATLRPYVAESPLRMFDLDNPPADLKLATVFQGSLPAWEVAWQFGDDEPSAPHDYFTAHTFRCGCDQRYPDHDAGFFISP